MADLTDDQIAAVHILWKRGNLRFLLHSGQRKMLEQFDGKSFACASTCRQIGKSFAAVAYCIEKCLQTPNKRVIYVAPTAKQVRGIALKVLKPILATCPPELFPHKTQDELIFKNGSTLILAGCHNKGDRLRGLTANMVVVDEARDIPAADFAYISDAVIKPMLATTGGALVIVTTPPDSPDHPFCMEYIPKAIIAKSFFVATYKDNPLLEPAFRRELTEQDKGELSTIAFRREYLADYTTADQTRLICPSFNYEEQIRRLEEYQKVKSPPDRIDYWVGIDLGCINRTAMVFGLFDQMHNKLIIIGENVFANPTTKDVVEAIMSGEKKYFRDMDSTKTVTRITDIDLMFINSCRKEYGLNMRQVIKQDRISMIAFLDDHIRNGQTIIDVKACPNLAQQLKGGLWNMKRTDYEASSDGSHMDAIDALKYLDLSVIRTSYNRPQGSRGFASEPYTSMPTIHRKQEQALPLDAMRGGFSFPR